MLINFNKCLIQNLNKRFKIDYISQGLLSTDELDDITKPFYDSLED
jgi:Ca2+-binding EF-hand superfamily protein